MRFRHLVLTIVFYLTSTDKRRLSVAYQAFEYLYEARDPFQSLSVQPLQSEIIQMRRHITFAPFIPIHRRYRTERYVYHCENRSVVTYWVSCDTIDTSTISKQPFVLYLHGGVYVFGDINGYLGFESQFSNIVHLPICHVEYSLGPEKPLPNALEDVFALYKHFLAEGSSASHIVIMGDSAGGGLSLLLIQTLIALHIPTPATVVVISPWCDLSISGDGCDLVDVGEELQLVRALRKQAFGGHDEPDQKKIKQLSPLFGSFAGFPPMYIATGQSSRLNNDSDRLVTKATEQNAHVTYDRGTGLLHIFPIFFQYYPEGRKSIQKICHWILEQINVTKNYQ